MAALRGGSGSIAGAAASSCSARKRRAQRDRALGRHVGWLANLAQAQSCHHTAASRQCPGCEELRRRVAALEQQVSRGGVVASGHSTGVKAEAVQPPDEEVLPVPWAWPEQPPHIVFGVEEAGPGGAGTHGQPAGEAESVLGPRASRPCKMEEDTQEDADLGAIRHAALPSRSDPPQAVSGQASGLMRGEGRDEHAANPKCAQYPSFVEPEESSGVATAVGNVKAAPMYVGTEAGATGHLNSAAATETEEVQSLRARLSRVKSDLSRLANAPLFSDADHARFDKLMRLEFALEAKLGIG